MKLYLPNGEATLHLSCPSNLRPASVVDDGGLSEEVNHPEVVTSFVDTRSKTLRRALLGIMLVLTHASVGGHDRPQGRQGDKSDAG